MQMFLIAFSISWQNVLGGDTKSCSVLDAHIGKKENQDWHRAVKLAAALIQENPGSRLLLVTGLKFPGWENPSELANYIETAQSLGVKSWQIIAFEEGGETISQLEVAEAYAARHHKKLVIISTWTHYLRIRWLTRGKGYEHHAVFGMPIIKPLIADVIFTFAFPVIELVGLRPWFVRRLRARRASGKI